MCLPTRCAANQAGFSGNRINFLNVQLPHLLKPITFYSTLSKRELTQQCLIHAKHYFRQYVLLQQCTLIYKQLKAYIKVIIRLGVKSHCLATWLAILVLQNVRLLGVRDQRECILGTLSSSKMNVVKFGFDAVLMHRYLKRAEARGK